jgi:hypothetical protein
MRHLPMPISEGRTPSSSSAKGSSNRALNLGAYNTVSSPPNINPPDEISTPVIYADSCAGCSDDGHIIHRHTRIRHQKWPLLDQRNGNASNGSYPIGDGQNLTRHHCRNAYFQSPIRVHPSGVPGQKNPIEIPPAPRNAACGSVGSTLPRLLSDQILLPWSNCQQH